MMPTSIPYGFFEPHNCLGWWELNRGPLAPQESALPLSYGSTPGNQPFSWLFRLRKLLFQLKQMYLLLLQLQQIQGILERCNCNSILDCGFVAIDNFGLTLKKIVSIAIFLPEGISSIVSLIYSHVRGSGFKPSSFS